jgi:predicted nucleotidyltransferase
MLDVGDNPSWVRQICERVIPRLVRIDAIRAVALGGSRARGTARQDSDLDLALYYDPSAPLPLEQLEAAARDLDDRHVGGLMTPAGAWGPGVNGGGWLLMNGRHVDFLYRDLQRVAEVVRACVDGRIDAVYQLGHPIGFQNQIYAGETHHCLPLYDPAGELSALKSLVRSYPARMQRALITKHLFDAEFETAIAMGPAGHGDIAYVAQCMARVAGFIVLVLYALNRRFYLNEKNALLESKSFPIRPSGLHQEIERVLGSLGNSPEELSRSVTAMRAIISELKGFCEDPVRRLV